MKYLKNSSTTPSYPIGIIGGGFGALMTYAILRFRGVSAEDIRIFTADSSPETSWSTYVRNIQQKTMRSESVAHFFPTDSPGLATYESLKTWSLKPLIASWFDQYHPTVDFFIEHVTTVAKQVGFSQSLAHCRIARIERIPNTFVLYEEGKDAPCAQVQHLIVAIGHGPLYTPEAVTKFKERYPHNPRVASALRDKKTYEPNTTTVVIGDGLTAATEWMNILERGGKVIAVSNRGFTFDQPLNTPRRYFSKRGLASYQSMDSDERMSALRDATKGSIPGYPYWKQMFADSQKNGALQLVEGELQDILPTSNGVRVIVRMPDGHGLSPLVADRLVSATGFAPVSTHPLMKTLIETYNLPTSHGVLETTNECHIPSLSTPKSTISVIGAAAAWALPCADSVGGMKIAARRITNSILGSDQFTNIPFKLRQWIRIIQGEPIL